MSRDEEFSAFVDAQWQPLLRTAVLLGCSLAEAEDLVQAALVRCYVKWWLVSGADDPRAYAAKVLVNLHRGLRRRRSASEVVVAAVPDVGSPDAAEHVADVDAVRRALAGLGDRAREVVVLRHYLQLSERECAEAIGVPAGTVKSRLSRARAELAASVELAPYRRRPEQEES